MKYLNVHLRGDNDHVWRATYDTGTEISVIRESLLESRGVQFTYVGKIQLRPMAGPSIPARLVRVHVKLVDETANDNGGCDYTSIIVAACDGLHDELILSGSVADDLIDKFNRCLVSKCNNDRDGEVTPASYDLNVKDEVPELHSNDDDITGIVEVITRSGTNTQPVVESDECIGDSVVEDDVGEDNNVLSDDEKRSSCPSFLDVDKVDSNKTLLQTGNIQGLIAEQQNDVTLKHAFSLARRKKGGYVVNDGILYRVEKHCGQTVTNLVVPENRRLGVIKLAHNTAHWGSKKTYQRIIMSGLTFPNLSAVVSDYVGKCEKCQLRARQTKADRVPISTVEREGHVFRKFYCDVCGPLIPGQKLRYNYALVLVDSLSRYPFAYPLSSLHAKNMCDAMMSMFEITGICSNMVLVSDNASYFRAALTQEFLKRLGVSPLFSTAYHPEGHAPVERLIQSLKGLISKLAYEQQNKWTTYLETWLGQREVTDANLTRSASEYLDDLLHRLQLAKSFALENDGKEQKRHVNNYNKRARDKRFVVGDRCLILQRDSTSSLFSRWKGPAEIVEVLSPYTYMVEYNNGRYHMHANNLRKFNMRVGDVECNAILCDEYLCDAADVELGNDVMASCNNCAIIYESDVDFGDIAIVEPSTTKQIELLPSQKIEPHKLAHLSFEQKQQLLAVLDEYPQVFSDTPGLCTIVQHEIPLIDGFVPRRFRAYRVPLHYREEVNAHIARLLELNFIEPSTSPQVSPIVVVLKPPDSSGRRAPRVTIDYRWVNKFTQPSVTPLEDIDNIIQEVGRSSWISLFDANSGYHQTPVKADDRWLTSFICDAGQFQWTRTPFGMRSSGTTYIRALRHVLRPVRQFTKSYVDDMAVHSDEFKRHLSDMHLYLKAISESGFTLNLSKCEFCKPHVKYLKLRLF